MNKVVLVTGGSRGIGKSCCIEFAKAGYDVLFNYRNNESEAVNTVEECKKYGVNCNSYKCDVSNESEVQSMFNYLLDTYGTIDVLVNNAGVSLDGLFSDFSKEDYNRVFGINVFGSMICAKEASKIMIRQHSGKIINISSMWGVVGSSCEVIYSASKSAIIGFTKALAKELGPSNINVNCVAPGVIDTDMNKCYTKETMDDLKEETPLLRIGKTIDISKTVLFLASDEASFITGEVINVNGGFVV